MANMMYGIPKAQLMAGDAMNRALTRMAHEMMEQLDLSNTVFVGIRRRGVPLVRFIGFPARVPNGGTWRGKPIILTYHHS